MGRLFWKFFFSYWAALLLAVVAVNAASWLSSVAWGSGNLPIEGGGRAVFIVNFAASTLRHGGPRALRGVMDDWQQHSNVLLYVVDADGRELLDRPVPAEALARASGLAESGSAIARRVQLADGASYLLFIPVQPVPFLQRLLYGQPPPSPMVPLAVGVVASLCFGALLAGNVSRPIRHLRGAFAARSGGRLETRVAPLIGRRRDDVADLGRDFDLMAQQLQALIASQRSLLHDVSHELRSPLARLQAAIGLARQSPDRLGSTLERIEAEATRLDDLVGELLTLARLEAGLEVGASEPPQETDLVDLVATIAADTRFEAEAAGRNVVFAGEGEVLASVRPALLHRAIENVARNAVKFTAAGSTVEIDASVTRTRAAFHVTIADHGPGVSEAELEAIFEPFYRGADRHAVAGFGLGLAIARRAVEAHGGTIRAKNRAGGGLEVEIVLPLAQAAQR